MSSILKVNTIQDTDGNNIINESGNVITIGASGDTITVPAGATLSGDLNASNLTSGTVPSARVSGAYTGITQVGTLTGLTTTGNINLGDSDVINLGASNDLQIFHTNSGSFIKDAGTSNLFIDTDGNAIELTSGNTAESMGRFIKDGAVELYHDNSKKFETTSSGATVTTTLSGANDLTLQTSDANEKITLDMSGTQRFNVNGSEKMRLTSTGLGIGTSSPNALLDVRGIAIFNEDGGDKDFRIESSTDDRMFFVDAGNSRIQIGTGASSGKLNVTGDGLSTSGTNPHIVIRNGNQSGGVGTGDKALIMGEVTAGGGVAVPYRPVAFGVENTQSTLREGAFVIYVSDSETVDLSADERLRITNDGNVGIGTSSPNQALTILGNPSRIMLTTASSGNGTLTFDGSEYALISNSSAAPITFATNSTERVRIDNSGNLLVGTTSNNKDITGASLRQSGDGYFTKNDTPLYLNRLTSDGEILRLSKDGTSMGYASSIGGTDIFFGSGDTGLRYRAAQDDIRPSNGSADRDNAIDLGDASARFDDIFASNGTIQTSDQNEKQSIQSLTTAEMNVAKRLSSLIKTFKWNSAVEEKGDNARTHTGIIAQDVQQAFVDEELDASNYALFTSDTWWENSEGDTKEEATDGYTEKTRLGVRYPELLSFIQAYNDQRFTELEARITQLENE